MPVNDGLWQNPPKGTIAHGVTVTTESTKSAQCLRSRTFDVRDRFRLRKFPSGETDGQGLDVTTFSGPRLRFYYALHYVFTTLSLFNNISTTFIDFLSLELVCYIQYLIGRQKLKNIRWNLICLLFSAFALIWGL